MIIRSDLKAVDVISPQVTFPVQGTSPSPDVTPGDVTLPTLKRKVTPDEVLHFFEQNSQATYSGATKALQVTRQTISRNVTRLVNEGRLVRDGKYLSVVPYLWSPEVT